MKTALLAALSLTAVLFAVVAHANPCPESCCCKVCSSPGSPSYPYGLLAGAAGTGANIDNPSVVGASCDVPVWADQNGVRDTGGAIVPPPPTLWWTEFTVFQDFQRHVAPTSCDCCRLSVHTTCAEEAPVATWPKNFRIGGNGAVIAGGTTSLEFQAGVELSANDTAEIRADPHCGYNTGATAFRSTAGDINTTTGLTSVWTIATPLPAAACYRVCYYHSGLTTPGWYDLGTLVVHADPNPAVTVAAGALDVLVEGNEVTFTFWGDSLLSVFDDTAEMRIGGSCGDAGPARDATGFLRAQDGADWCHPMPARKITATRPLQFIDPVYADCPAAQRVLLTNITWTLSLPAGGSYQMCYRRSGTWHTAGTVVVEAEMTARDSLMALYTSTAGASWTLRHNWGGADVCVYHGVRCNSDGKVDQILLGRNNLVGSLPAALFRGDFMKTLTEFRVDMNALTGPIPREIGAWRNLVLLDLTYNQLSGDLPGTLVRTALETIYLSNNHLEGDFPTKFQLISQTWFSAWTNISKAVAVAVPEKCPTVQLECSPRGSTDVGVFACGAASITEDECVTRGCCYNDQAPLTFGGQTCFTKRATTLVTHPQCQNQLTCTPVVV